MYEAPTPDLVEEVLVRTGDLQHRRVFYDGLRNPKWVRPLFEAGAFDNPPATVVDPEGYLRTTPWPEGDYLVRMAAYVAEDVASVLRSLQGNSDPCVQRTILKAAAHMPASAVREFLPSVMPLLQGSLQHAIDPGDWVRMIATLAADVEGRSDAMSVANAVYRPRPGSVEEKPVRRQRAAVPLEEWAYKRSLPALRKAMAPLGVWALRQFKIWLEEYQVHSGDFIVDRKRDFSTLTRPSIPPHEQNRGYDSVRNALIDAVRDEAQTLLQEGVAVDEVLDVLQRSDQPLVQRIALYVLAAAVGNEVSGAFEQGIEHLLDERFLEEDFRNEYSHLARALLSRLTAKQREEWVRLVLGGPYESLDDLQTRAERHLAEGEAVEFVVERYQQVWRRDVLASIGDNLPAEAARVLEELVDRWGGPAHPEFPNWMEFTEVTPRGPSESDRLASMSVTEVVDWLATWEPAEQGRGPDEPTIEGVARALEADVRSRPHDYAAAANLFAQLDPTYVRAYFSGLAEAIKSILFEEWAPVVELMTEVVDRDVDPDAEHSRFDRDVSWQFAQREVLRLINASLERGSDTEGLPLDSFANVAGRLRLNPDPTPAHEAKYGGDNMDPLTMSLNAIRPAAIATLADLLHYEWNGESVGIGRTSATAERLRDLLQDRMGAHADGSLSVAAAFGRSMGKLIDADEPWMKGNLTRLLGAPGAPDDEQYSDVVISTALATYRPSERLLRLLEGYYAPLYARGASGQPIAVGWKRDRSAIELIGDFVVELVIRGELPLDEPVVVNFFSQAPVSDRSSALGHLGWALGRAGEVAESIRARAMELVDSRVSAIRAGGDGSELGGFAWWVVADHFPPEWWLPILELALQATSVDPRGLLGEALQKASNADAGAALNVLELLLAQLTEPYERFGLIEHSPAVIAAALDSGDTDVEERGRALMSRLGRQGEVRLADLVEDRRRQT